MSTQPKNRKNDHRFGWIFCEVKFNVKLISKIICYFEKKNQKNSSTTKKKEKIVISLKMLPKKYAKTSQKHAKKEYWLSTLSSTSFFCSYWIYVGSYKMWKKMSCKLEI
jgi:hypothetical protein